MEFQRVMEDIELLGIQNDLAQSDRSKKYLNITRDTGEFLSVLVKATSSRRILEIGTSNGYSTIWLASALSDDGKVYTIEANSEKIAEASLLASIVRDHLFRREIKFQGIGRGNRDEYTQAPFSPHFSFCRALHVHGH